MPRTVCALSYHTFTFVGLALYCCSKRLYTSSFTRAEFSVLRVSFSSTITNPFSTSLLTFRASMAISTTYIRFIIF